MNEYLIAALVVFLLSALLDLAQYKNTDVSYNTSRTAIEAHDKVFAGTGFFVQDQVILTAYHVIKGFKVLSVLYHGKWYPASVINTDSRHDLALLRINTGSFTAYAAITRVYDKEVVTLKGYDLGQFVLKTHRVKFDASLNQDGLNGTKTTGELCEGDSGSPAFDSNNYVVGIEDKGSTEKQDITRKGCARLNWLIKPEIIQDFLSRNKIISQTTESTINIVYIEKIT